jgi:transporter family protein
MTTSGPWVYWSVLSAIFAALTAIFAKIGIVGVNADMATLIRATIIVMVLAGFVQLSGQWSDPFALTTRTWGFLVLSALATGASWVCYFRALQLGDASKVAPIDKLSVVLVVVFAAILLGERPTIRDWTGVALIAAGAILLTIRR